MKRLVCSALLPLIALAVPGQVAAAENGPLGPYDRQVAENEAPYHVLQKFGEVACRFAENARTQTVHRVIAAVVARASPTVD